LRNYWEETARTLSAFHADATRPLAAAPVNAAILQHLPDRSEAG